MSTNQKIYNSILEYTIDYKYEGFNKVLLTIDNLKFYKNINDFIRTKEIENLLDTYLKKSIAIIPELLGVVFVELDLDLKYQNIDGLKIKDGFEWIRILLNKLQYGKEDIEKIIKRIED